MRTIKILIGLLFISACAFAQSIGIYPQVNASGTDTYVASFSGVTPAPTSYSNGQRFAIKFTNANTGASTININALGVKTIVKSGSSSLEAGDISSGQILILIYDGTNLQIVGGGGGSSGGGDFWPLSGEAVIGSSDYVVKTVPTGRLFFYPETDGGVISIGGDYGGEAGGYSEGTYIFGGLSGGSLGTQGISLDHTFGITIAGQSKFQGITNRAGFNIGTINGGIAGNPSAGLVNGQGWLNGTTNKIMFQINGTRREMATEAYVDAVDVLKANLASPTFTGTVVLPSTTSIGTVSNTEIGFVDGLTSAAQTQIDLKAPLASPTFTGTVVLPSTTSIGTVSNTELSYVDNVTSSIQTQFTNKQAVDSDLTAIAALTPTNDDVMQYKSGAWANRTIPQVRTDLGQVANLTFQEGSITYTNQPNTEQYLSGVDTHRIVFDATNYTQVRITCYVRVSSASVNSPRLYLQYTTQSPTTASPTWVTIGAGTVASGEAVTMGSSANRSTSWITIPAPAKGDILFRVATNGGDGVEDPQVASVVVQFKN